MTVRKTAFGIAAGFVLLTLAGCSDPYGVTPSHPLGTFEVMDRILIDDKGLEKSERKFAWPELFNQELNDKFGELKVYQYQDFPKTSRYKHVVLLAVDEVNIIRAVGGTFHSGRKGFDDSGSKVEAYLAGLWGTVNDGPVKFVKKNEPGIDVNEYLISTLDQGNVHGIWKKTPGTGNASHRRTLSDQILLWID